MQPKSELGGESFTIKFADVVLTWGPFYYMGEHTFGYLHDWDKDTYTLEKDVSLSVYENSAGMQYAKDNNIPYTVLS